MKTFDELFAELGEKALTRPEGSGTVAALDAGVHTIGKKLVEEAAESWMAAEHEGKERAAEELSQLLYHAQVMMHALGLSLDDVAARPLRTFSGGEQKRMALEVLLRGDDDILLLDEPDNFLDVPAKRWLERELNATRKTVLFVSHDRYFTRTAATRFLEIARGRLVEIDDPNAFFDDQT